MPETSDAREPLDAAERAELERLRRASRVSGLITWTFELSTGTLECAKATFNGVEEALGYAEMPAEVTACFELLVPPADLERVLGDLEAELAGIAERYEAEYRVCHRDGSIRWRQGRGVVIRDDNGRAIRVFGACVDITRIKEAAAEEVRATQERLGLAMKLAGFTVAEIDVRGVEDPGTAAVKHIGHWEERGLARSMTFIEFLRAAVVPEDLESVVDMFYATVRNGPSGPDPAIEFRVRTPDGGVRWRSGFGKCFFDDDGTPLRVMSISYDIERTKRAEEDARRAVEQLRLATDLSGVGVWGYALSPDGDLSKAISQFDNDGVMLSLGYDLTDVAPTLVARLGAVVSPLDQPRMQVALEGVFTGRTPMFDEECRFTAKDGSLQWKLVRGLVTRNEVGLPLTFMGTAVDITQLKQVQEELQRVRDRLELAVTGSKACTWDFELTDGTIANARATYTNLWELMGYATAPPGREGLGDLLELTMTPEDRIPFLTEVQAFLDGYGQEWEREMRAYHKDGTERWHLTRGVAERDAAGKATRFTGASIDITDRKLTEKALQESEERFRQTFENAAVGMILTDLDGRFLEYNSRFCDFLGYTREELAGHRFVDFMMPDEVGADVERQRSVVRGDIPWFTRDKRYLQKSGATVWGSITVSVIQRHADGTPVHVMGILQDISERKALEVELEKAQARMQLAMRGSDVAVFDGNIPGGDPACSTWTHFNMWEPLGVDPANAPTNFEGVVALTVHPDDLGSALEIFGAAIEAKAPDLYLEHRVMHRDGSVLWRLTRGTFVYDDAGTLARMIGTTSDITKLKRIESELQRAREAAESASRAKDDFLANVSHEIRTPMNAILGMTELAIDSSPNEHQRQLLTTVRSAAKNLLTIINDLLDFSKIASGKLTLDSADFSLRAAVGDTLRALAVRAHRKGLELLCSVGADVPDALEGDAGRLRQVLMNLVGNAIKFTPRGEIEVHVNCEPSPGPAVGLVFTVRDTGIGIAPEKQAVIFRAFEQEDSSTTRKYGGTGLGLTISAQLASLMDGEITVTSAVGKGSTFRFTARFARSTRPDATTVSPERLANLRVLVVDDNDANRRIVIEWLTSWRMQPAGASDGTQALAALASAHAAGQPFSLVLLDGRMPDIDGVALAAEIHQRWEDGAPRLILLSSDDAPDRLETAREHGVLAHLLKPVQQSELLEAIWAVMNLAATVPASAGPAGGPSVREQPLRILVAEDNELNVILLKELLAQHGHTATFAHDGRTALDLALGHEFDLMLLDLHMPELDGFEVVKAIRDHERGSAKHLRIVALTARSSARDRDRCLAAGMDEFLAKPIEAAALWAAMERVVAAWPLVATAPKPLPPGLLDARAILRATGGQSSILDKLRVVVRRTLPTQMSRVRAALASGDLSELREAAHQLVGTVGAFSTVTAGVASTLEDAASRYDAPSCVALVEQLGTLCDALLDAMATLSMDSLSL